MGRQPLREIEHRDLVGARHRTEFDFAGVGFGLPRIGTCLDHIDLFPKQESSFGQSRLIALGPATRLT